MPLLVPQRYPEMRVKDTDQTYPGHVEGHS